MRVAMVPREVEERGQIAKRLRAAREQLDLTIERAAADAGVPLRYARLLEGQKPPDVGVSDDLYLIPFFRRYAAGLGLPAEEMLPDFLGQVQELPPPSPLHLPTGARRARRSLLRPIAVLLAVAAAVIVIMRQAPQPPTVEDEHWSDDERASGGDGTLVATAVEPTPNPSAPERDLMAAATPQAAGVGTAASVLGAERAPTVAGTMPGPREVAPPNAAAPAAATSPGTAEEIAAASSPAPNATPADVAAAPAGARELRIVAAEETWLSLAVDDEPKRSILLQPGETRSWTATRAFTLTIGNAGGITVSLDGRELPPLGRSGQVVRNLRLPEGETSPG